MLGTFLHLARLIVVHGFFFSSYTRFKSEHHWLVRRKLPPAQTGGQPPCWACVCAQKKNSNIEVSRLLKMEHYTNLWMMSRCNSSVCLCRWDDPERLWVQKKHPWGHETRLRTKKDLNNHTWGVVGTRSKELAEGAARFLLQIQIVFNFRTSERTFCLSGLVYVCLCLATLPSPYQHMADSLIQPLVSLQLYPD